MINLIKEKKLNQLIKELNKDLKKEKAGFRAISTLFGVNFITDFNIYFLTNVSLHFSTNFYSWVNNWFQNKGYKLRWSEQIIVDILPL